MNTFDPLTHSQQLLLALLKLALWNTVPDTTLFAKADNTVWNEVFHLSVDQGIKAIVFDGIMLLPEELKPSRSVKISWALNTEAIERRYEQELAVANEIAGVFAKNDIKTLLFKGIGLSQYYPVPQHREFGDIDIYLFGKQKEGDRLLVQMGAIKEKNDISRHTGLIYKGISVDNHKHFLLSDNFHKATILEAHLLQSLADCKPLNKGFVNTALLPPPDFDILFIACHALRHFLDGFLALRHLCDWALFLKANRGNIDFAAYRRLITESGLLKLADAFTALSVKYLELDPDMAPPFDRNPMLEDKIIQNAFNYLYFPKTKKRSPFNIVRHKIKVLTSKKWKYNELLYPRQFYNSVWEAMIFHLRHPAMPVKMQTK